jgi:hypothetical protein
MGFFRRLGRKVLSRRVLLSAVWIVALIVVAVAINLIGIHIVGSVGGWSRWLDGHRWLFFAWRLCVYGGTAWGWWWMRRRMREREMTSGTQVRLWRAEIAIVMVVLMLEGSVMLR